MRILNMGPAIIAASLVILALLAAAGCGDDGQQADLATDTGGRLALEEKRHDFGEVPVGQMVKHSFTIRNSGDGELRLGELEVKRLEGC